MMKTILQWVLEVILHLDLYGQLSIKKMVSVEHSLLLKQQYDSVVSMQDPRNFDEQYEPIRSQIPCSFFTAVLLSLSSQLISSATMIWIAMAIVSLSAKSLRQVATWQLMKTRAVSTIKA